MPNLNDNNYQKGRNACMSLMDMIVGYAIPRVEAGEEELSKEEMDNVVQHAISLTKEMGIAVEPQVLKIAGRDINLLVNVTALQGNKQVSDTYNISYDIPEIETE